MNLATIFDYKKSLLFATTFLLAFVVHRIRRSGGNRKYPPSLPWLPVIGSLPFLRGDVNTLPRFLMEKVSPWARSSAFTPDRGKVRIHLADYGYGLFDIVGFIM